MTDEIEAEDGFIVKDSNGNVLTNGDTVLVIKDLKVKGSSAGLKKGTKVRDIRLSDEVEGVTGKIEGMKGIYIRAEFVKKA
jgi:protein PhnA